MVRVSQEKRRRIDEHMLVAVRCLRIEAPQRRFAQTIAPQRDARRFRRDRAKTIIRLDQENLRPAAFKPDDPRAADLASIEPHIVRAHSRRERIDIQKLLVETGNFQIDFPGLIVPIHREIAGHLLHALRFR